MKYLILLLLCIPVLGLSQEQKSVKPLPALPDEARSAQAGATTRAVVVGISDYQNIPDLNFADRDAQAFADWLKSPAGGSIPQENIALLTNEKATNSKILLAFYRIVEESKEGDTAIIYFSGHGDIESKILGQTGFLLAYDSPNTNYIGSSINLRDIQDFISTLSIINKVRVFIITDACHAGNLAGTTINGTQATAQALAQQFANEVKIVSCQPNEFSLEGEQWGGGRGVFSWHLVEGLTGLADKNGDGVVNLFEIGRYLEDKVPAETAPHPQMPMTVGERQTQVSQVYAPALATLSAQKQVQSASSLAIKSKGLTEGLLNLTDSATQKLYADFQRALDSGYLLQPKGRCALDYYTQLIEKQEIKSIHGLIKRNFAAALIDEVQQALNALLDNDPYEANNWKYNPQKYLEYPEYLQRAMDILGEKHLIYNSLKAKKFYFEGYNLAKNLSVYQDQMVLRDSLKTAAKTKYLESLSIEPNAAYVCYAIGSLYLLSTPYQPDSLLVWLQKAVDRSPSWLLPYLDAAEAINFTLDDVPRSEAWLLQAKKWNPTSYLLLLRLAWLKQWQDKADEANTLCRELIAMRPELADAWATLSNTQYWLQNDYLASEISARRALELQPNQDYALLIFGNAVSKTNPAKAVIFCKQSLLKESLNVYEKGCLITSLVMALIQLRQFEEAEKWIDLMEKEGYGYGFLRATNQSDKGRILLLQNRFKEAEEALQKSLLMENSRSAANIQAYALLGEMKNRQGQYSDAEAFYKKALNKPFQWNDNPFKNEAHFLYGRFLVHQNRPAEAQIQFDNALKISPKTWHYPMGMALLAAKNRRKKEALDWLEKALNSYFFDITAIYEEPLFSKIRKTKRFKSLMLKQL